MLAKTPPMGWNSWNTFGRDITEDLIKETADAMVEQGYKDAGYEYVVIDDCWAEIERDSEGRLVADRVKFPGGMKSLSDYIHSKGLKFGMYSCAGVRTCAGYPSSYDHEYIDAKMFASWGVDFLKYDFCNFPKTANCKNAYQTMSNALRVSGREILFSACNWGVEDPGRWMRSIGVHMYRSTGDIFDNFESFVNIGKSQIENLCYSAPGCFNDIDMLIAGMYGKGNVGLGGCNDIEYRTHFALWCLFGVPLMIGCDIRNASEETKKLLLNKALIRINQDEECRPPFLAKVDGDKAFSFIKYLSNNEFILAYFNFHDNEREVQMCFSDVGVPYSCGYGFDMEDIFTGEKLGVKTDYYNPIVEAHGCKIYKAEMIQR